MVDKFFTWSEADMVGYLCIQYYDVVTQCRLPGIDKYTEFDCVEIDCDTGRMLFYAEGGDILHEIKLELCVQEPQ